MKRYIFVTGGVVSSHIDPGTLNPYEHGERYVTVDGMYKTTIIKQNQR